MALRTVTSSGEPEMDTAATSLARKRRIELRNMQRTTVADEDLDSVEYPARKRACVDQVADTVTSEDKPSLTGIKRQSRYDPGVPMTKDALKTWRKEARRVRNRESAAASRKRNRDRVAELESTIEGMKTKYDAALLRIAELEARLGESPDILHEDLGPLRTTMESRPSSPEPIQTVSPPMSPATSPAILDIGQLNEDVNEKCQHIMEMISRPAVSN